MERRRSMFSRTMRSGWWVCGRNHIAKHSMIASCSCDLQSRAPRCVGPPRARRLRALVAFSSAAHTHPPRAVIFDLGKVRRDRPLPCRRHCTPPAAAAACRRRCTGACVATLPICSGQHMPRQVLLDFDFHKSSRRLAAACRAPTPTRQVRWADGLPCVHSLREHGRCVCCQIRKTTSVHNHAHLVMPSMQAVLLELFGHSPQPTGLLDRWGGQSLVEQMERGQLSSREFYTLVCELSGRNSRAQRSTSGASEACMLLQSRTLMGRCGCPLPKPRPASLSLASQGCRSTMQRFRSCTQTSSPRYNR